MKIHTTNYIDTFIEVAEDCPTSTSEVPPTRGNKRSIANLQFEMLKDNPYQYTSDDVLFQVYAIRNNLPKEDWEAEKAKFFSKGQPCFRSSPLTKRYGWGIHNNSEGKIALYGVGTDAYHNFSQDGNLTIVKAMRAKRK